MLGCGRNQAPVLETDRTAKKPELTAGTWAGEQNDASITVSLSADGKFQAVFRGGSYRSVVKGKAKLEDVKVVLEATEFNGKPPQKAAEKKPVSFTYSPDWSTLTSEEGMALQRKI